MAGRFDAMAAGIHSHEGGCDVVVREIATGALARSGHATHRRGRRDDPDEWWRAMLAAIDDAGGFRDVAAFAITAQPAVVVLDADGVVIRPALTVRDRGREQVAAGLVAEVGAEEFRARTGSVPTASSPITALRWLRDREPDAAARTEAAVLAHDWLTWRLRGFGPDGDTSHGSRLEELATDHSEASVTGYWNVGRGRWEHALFNIALGHAAIKPRVMRPDGWGGETAKRPEQGIRTGRVMGVGCTEYAAALLGWAAGAGDVVVTAGRERTTVTAITASPVAATAHIDVADDASGCFTASLHAPTPRPADVEASVRHMLETLRAAGVVAERMLLPAPDGPRAARLADALTRVGSHAGLAVVATPTGTHVADGAAAQAAWATSRTLPRWPGVAANVPTGD